MNLATEAGKCNLPPGSATAKPRLLVRSRASPTHHPASLPGRALLWALSNGLPCPQRSRSRSRLGESEPAEAAKGSAPRLLPLEPHRPHARSKRRGAVARDAPLRAARATSPQNSGRHRPVAGNSAGMPALAGLRESGAPRRLPGISADKPSKEALHRRPIGGTQAKALQRRKAPRKLLREQRTRAGRSRRACRTPAALSIAARDRACPKGPENGLGTGAAPTQVHGAQCGTEEAPQERRRGCTRTPRRRRRSGWTGP